MLLWHWGVIIVAVAIIAFVAGQKSYIRKVKALGSLLILVDEVDGTRYPLCELNNDHDLWELKTGEIATFIVKKRENK